MKTLKHHLRILMRFGKKLFYRTSRNITEFINSFYTPIYYYYFSRDCDMCETSSYNVFKGSRKAFEAYKEESYEGAEGAMSFDEITKDEYMEHENEVSTRDRVMEAYENGNGTSIYV